MRAFPQHCGLKLHRKGQSAASTHAVWDSQAIPLHRNDARTQRTAQHSKQSAASTSNARIANITVECVKNSAYYSNPPHWSQRSSCKHSNSSLVNTLRTNAGYSHPTKPANAPNENAVRANIQGASSTSSKSSPLPVVPCYLCSSVPALVPAFVCLPHCHVSL